ncbi:HEXXH motif-containing putative peptide modification protein [Streptomyces canus]|uniref:aKG-HExxH-type peptide beta-hydroxylase n=1 Tax=Streptomyces canus TaxID=58343 RepID=UPI00368EBF8A
MTDVANTREILIGTEMPVNAVDPKKLFEGGRAEGHQTVAKAVSILALLGYGTVIDEGAAIVVLLKKRQLGQETSSWATAAFPATVYLDWYDHPEFLAKDLLHEASHAWLNDALEARQINLPEEALFYSPWKKRDRPAYGMIHSVFAFSRVTNCLTRLRDHTTDPAVRTYCDIRVHEERLRLAEARSAALAALSVLPDAQLTDLVRGEYEEALTAHGRTG